MAKTKPFFERLRAAQERKNSLLCVGLDPDQPQIDKLWPDMGPLFRNTVQFCESVVHRTAKYACAFKPNAAFFASQNHEDFLAELVRMIRKRYRTPVILDAKRGDIGNTAAKYAEEVFVRFAADAVTVNPYMGSDTIEPYLEHEGKGVIVLCRTSNPGGGEFQDLVTNNGLRVYERVALKMAELDARYGGDRIGLVVGATRPAELERVRELVGNMPLLVPGIGAQGGEVEATVKAGQTLDGFGMMVNSSRGVIYANDQALAARETRDQINLYRNYPA